jgi:hypothetical protein
MMQIVLIGLGAGAATALLFASVASGSLLSIVLFYVAPLPIMIAALGWSHLAALIAALSAACALALVFGGVFFIAFLAGTGLPAWWLGYLTMLARRSGNGQAALEWYPVGRLLLWAAGFAALVVIVGVLNLGTDFDSFRANFQDALNRVIRVNPQVRPTPGGESSGTLIDFLVIAIPPAAAVLATVTNVVNLWLAGKVVRFSGRLKRPWPDLSAMEFPKPAAIALAAAIVVSFFGGFPGLLGSIASASLIMAYGILGFAVLHAISRNMKGRVLTIGAAYVSVAVFGWPVLPLGLLALVDQFFGLRQRIGRNRPPPARL